MMMERPKRKIDAEMVGDIVNCIKSREHLNFLVKENGIKEENFVDFIKLSEIFKEMERQMKIGKCISQKTAKECVSMAKKINVDCEFLNWNKAVSVTWKDYSGVYQEHNSITVYPISVDPEKLDRGW